MPSTDQIDIEQNIGGRYMVVSRLGSGAHGTVYLAQDTELDRKVAIKVLAGLFAGEWAENKRQRFLREAKALSLLNHGGIVGIKHIGQLSDGRPYLVMEYVEGQRLSDLIAQQSTLSCRQATRICIDVAEALAHAHERGIVHRDIKPENIIVTENDGNIVARVLDFGLSSLTQSSLFDDLKITNTGTLLGTPGYMSPEQGQGHTPNPRWDIYSLGCVFFTMLSGEPPYPTTDPLSALWHHANSPFPKLSDLDREANLPAALQSIIERATAKDPAARYAAVKDMLDDLSSRELLVSDARIYRSRDTRRKPYENSKSSWWKGPALSAGLLVLLPVVSFSLIASPALAARTTLFLAKHASPQAAIEFARVAINFDVRLEGAPAVRAFAQDTLTAPEITTLPSRDQLVFSTLLFDALGQNLSAARDWNVLYSLMDISFDSLREDKKLKSTAPVRALDKCSSVLSREPLSKQQWSELLRVLESASRGRIYKVLKNETSLCERLRKLTAMAYLEAAGKVDEDRQSYAISHFVGLAELHVEDLSDQPFQSYIEPARKLIDEHPGMLVPALSVHRLLATRYLRTNRKQLWIAEQAKVDDLQVRLRTMPQYKIMSLVTKH